MFPQQIRPEVPSHCDHAWSRESPAKPHAVVLTACRGVGKAVTGEGPGEGQDRGADTGSTGQLHAKVPAPPGMAQE